MWPTNQEQLYIFFSGVTHSFVIMYSVYVRVQQMMDEEYVDEILEILRSAFQNILKNRTRGLVFEDLYR